MLIRFFLIIFLFFIALNTSAAKILTTTSHIASIASMVSDDVDFLSSSNSCPFHYSLKPSDISKIEEAEIIIIIDEKSEPLAKTIIEKAKGRVISISSLPGVKIRNGNCHIWLNLDFVKILLKELSNINGSDITDAMRKIEKLLLYKKERLYKIKNPAILTKSLEYLFDDLDIKPHRFFMNMKGVKSLEVIKHTDFDIILADSNSNFDSLEEKIGKKIIYINSDQWPKEGYVSYYRNILANIE